MQSRIDKRVRNRSSLLAAGLAASLLAACGGGGDQQATGPDPGIIDFPIAYVKRPYPTDNNNNIVQPDWRDPLVFSAGGDLYLRTRATQGSAEINITGAVTNGQGDVRDVDVSYDGSKLVFALHKFEPNPNNPTETWDLYEYDIAAAQLRKLMSDATASAGDDLAPHYLPDGRIVFASNRQINSRAILTTEATGKPVFSALDEDRNIKSYALHTIDADGSNGSIRQITFNQSHDLDPVVLDSGEIVFSRWDHAGAGNDAVNLYKIRADGSGQQLLYGAHSHDTGSNGSTIQFTSPRPLPDGRLLAIIKPFTGTFSGGDIVAIDTASYLDNDQALALYNGSLAGPGQIAATVNSVITDGSPSPGGRYSAAYPLWDGTNRMLVSKGFCGLDVAGQARACVEPYLSNPAAVETPPEYSIWMYDLASDTEKPVVPLEAGTIITDVVAVQSRTLPGISAASNIDTNWEAEGVGALHIRSVYDQDGTFNDFGSGIADIASLAHSDTPADSRPARFLRLVKAVGIPDPDDGHPDLDNDAFGPNRNLGMREILGYTPIEPDGSVMVKVPANVPFAIEILDQAGRRIGPRHDNWLQVRAGETMQCHGCHTHQTQNNATPLPHGRRDAEADPVNAGAGYNWSIPTATSLKTIGLLSSNSGETMAEMRYRRCNIDVVGCPAGLGDLEPTVDLRYTDLWTDTSASATVNNPIDYRYADMVASATAPDEIFASADAAPTPSTCQTTWQPNCRIVINYPAHIHPLWNKARGANTCTNCHSTRDAANQIVIPAGQLNLSDTNLTDDPTFVANANGVEHAYEELTQTDTELEQPGGVNTALSERIVNGPIDPDTGLPVPVPVNVNPSMSANGARASFFMEKLTNTELNANRSLAGQTVNHAGFMSAAELRLVAEWLDIGAQYVNNPFDPAAPVN